MHNLYTFRYRILFFIVLLSFPLSAQEGQLQQRKIDSLTTLLQQRSVSDTLTVNRMNKLANILSQERQLELATSYAKKALTMAEKLNFPQGEANAYNTIGVVHIHKGEYPSALKNLFVALEKWEKLGEKKEIALTHIQIGNTYDYEGDYPTTLTHFFSALKLYEEIKFKKGIAMAYSAIGFTYFHQEQYAEALTNHVNALQIRKEIGDKQGISQSYNNIGTIYDYQGQLPEALEHYYTSLKIKEEIGDKYGMAGTYLNIGAINLSLHKYQEALENTSIALKMMEEFGDRWGAAQAYSIIGLAELKLNRPTASKKNHEKALLIANETGSKGLFRDIYYNITQADSTLGNYRDAYENYKQYISYRDSLINEENEKESLAISMGYEYDKKAAVIQAELETKNLQRNVAYAGFGVMVLLTVLTIYLFKMRGKRLRIEKENLELQRREVETIKENERFKTRFLTNISHEFRTPLTLINGHVEVLKEQGRPEDFLHFSEIEQNGKRLLTLINQLLDLSKMESGQYKLKYKKGNVINEVSMLVQSFHSYAEQHTISLLLEQTEKAKKATAYPFVYSSEALAMIITNLLSNAIKYTPSGGNITVTIDCAEDRVTVSIADSGQGIAAEHLPKIFNRFYQVDEPGQRTYMGSGIGLALVKELVLLHGGEISVESPMEGGCIFTFSIQSKTEEIEPTEIVEPHTILLAKEKEETDEEQQNTTLPLLLIIEDQPELRAFIVRNLGKEYRYEEASNGKEGIAQAKKLLPDLIISDVMMPDVDGLELCETLKNDVATSHIPIILLTAKAEQKDKLTGLETGADDYLTKPFSLQELKLRVKNILSFKELLRAKFKGNTLPSAKETPELSSRDRKFLDDVTALVEPNISNVQFGVTLLAEGVFLSVSQLNRKLKTITGKTPADFIRTIRLEKAIELLKNGESVADVAWAVGFEDSVYFSKVFKKQYGFPPSSTRK
ncbi:MULTISPECIES: tetratricopeptide repeat protein [unclassified Myroides]|uniref:tetratricopeptide repeat protein n=1 Tax=unclassified Myroides TaxID=2642485 RepID=UPI003D2F5AE7